jgi:hypothetical protein
MPKTPKALRAKKINFSGTQMTWDYLTDLMNTGNFGRSPGEAAERLVSQGVEDAIARQKIPRRPPISSEDK